MANVAQPVHHGRRGGGAVQHEADHAAEAGHLRGEMRGLVPAGQARISSTRRSRGSLQALRPIALNARRHRRSVTDRNHAM